MNKKDNGVYNYMDCSTVHITKEDDDFLEEYKGSSAGNLIVNSNEYGYWVHSMDTDEYDEDFEEAITDLSTSLKDVLRKARKEDAIWIKIDRDGFEHDDLERYDW